MGIFLIILNGVAGLQKNGGISPFRAVAALGRLGFSLHFLGLCGLALLERGSYPRQIIQGVTPTSEVAALEDHTITFLPLELFGFISLGRWAGLLKFVKGSTLSRPKMTRGPVLSLSF